MMLLLLLARPGNVIFVVDRDALGHVVDLVHTHQACSQLEHVVPERDDDELGVLGTLFDVVRHDGDLARRLC